MTMRRMAWTVACLFLSGPGFSLAAHVPAQSPYHLIVEDTSARPLQVGDAISYRVSLTNISQAVIPPSRALQFREFRVPIDEGINCQVTDTGSLPSNNGVRVNFPELAPGETASCLVTGTYLEAVDPGEPYNTFWAMNEDGTFGTIGNHLTVPFNPDKVVVQQYQELRDLFPQTGGNQWITNTGWGGELGGECDWFGITCDQTRQRVLSIDLPDNRLRGDLSSVMALLKSVPAVNLSGNHLTGLLTGDWKDFQVQVLDLSGNELVGTLPALFASPLMLEVLDLSHNGLSGIIPDAFSSEGRLRVLDLSANQLRGEIPRSLAVVGDLGFLDLSGNQLSGRLARLVPPERIENLNLSNNQLEGSIPRAWAALTELESLNLCDNLITGRVPAEFAQSPSLESLSICLNRLGGRKFLSDQIALDDHAAYLKRDVTISQLPAVELDCSSPERGAVSYAWSSEFGGQLEVRMDDREGQKVNSGGGNGSATTGGWASPGRRFHLVHRFTGQSLAHFDARRTDAGCPGTLFDIQPGNVRTCYYGNVPYRLDLETRRVLEWNLTGTNVERVGIFINDASEPWITSEQTIGSATTGFWTHFDTRYQLVDLDTNDVLATEIAKVDVQLCSI